MLRLRLKDCLVITTGILLIAVFTLALVASPATAQTAANGPYYATPSWDQKITTGRFVVLSNWNSETVLDRETGLVWERVPNASGVEWFFASNDCLQAKTGGRLGWRLPTVQELLTLLDPATGTPGSVGPDLPAGHPFGGVSGGTFWTTTRLDGSGSNARFIVTVASPFDFGNPIAGLDPINPSRFWCVRGGTSPGLDAQ